jgi:hypothetical protein
MSLGLAFWVLFVIWIVFDGGVRSGNPMVAGYWWGPWIVFVLLIFILGWHNFGFIIHQ